MTFVSKKYSYIRLAPLLEFTDKVITMLLDIKPTNMESRTEDLSSKKK